MQLGVNERKYYYPGKIHAVSSRQGLFLVD